MNYFPIIIQNSEKKIVLIYKPEDLPSGAPFTVLVTQSSEREYDLYAQAYNNGYSDGFDKGLKEAELREWVWTLKTQRI